MSTEIIFDFRDVLDPLDMFFETVFGDREGYVALSFGRAPNKPTFFVWPVEKDKMLAVVERRNRRGENVFFCPALLATTNVSPVTEDGKGGGLSEEHSPPVEPMICLWVDIDQRDKQGRLKKINHTLIDQLGALTVRSVRAGNRYLFVPLADDGVDRETHKRLNTDLKNAVGGDDKQSYVSWLRLPTSLGYKPALGLTKRLTILDGPERTWAVGDLEALIASQASRSTSPKRRQGTRVSAAQGVNQDQLRASPGVHRALTTWEGTEQGKRNEAHRAVTRECFKARGSQDAAVALILDQPWCKGDEKWVRDDVAREYKKAAAEGLPQLPGEDFWDARPMLAHLRDYAAERLLPRWALLGHTLLRFAGNIPPCYVLPDIIGDYGSLNLFIALCGPPAGGKTTSGTASRRAVILPHEPPHEPLSTGQGMTRCYMTPGVEGPTYHTDSVIFGVDEVSKLRANLNQPSATLLGELNTAWVGNMLGAANADPTRRVKLSPHTYRLGLHVGVQPALADALLEHEETGFPQRFLWFDARLEVDAEPTPERTTSPWKWEAPDIVDHGPRFDQEPDHFEVVQVPGFVRDEVIADHLKRSKGLSGAMPAHWTFCRLKVAAVLMWMDGRTHEMNAEDWDLAGQIMAHSDHTRQAAESYRAVQESRKADRAAKRSGERAAIAEGAKEEAQVKRAKTRILGLLKDRSRVKSYLTGSGMTASLRGAVAEQALDELRRSKAVRVTAKIDKVSRKRSEVFHLNEAD